MAEEFNSRDLDELEFMVKRLLQMLDRQYTREIACFDWLDQSLDRLCNAMEPLIAKGDQACRVTRSQHVGKNTQAWG